MERGEAVGAAGLVEVEGEVEEGGD